VSTQTETSTVADTQEPTRNQILTLAALLSATVLTAFVALFGSARAPVVAPAPVTVIQSPQTAPVQAPPTARREPGD
jgi:hypothetical protein